MNCCALCVVITTAITRANQWCQNEQRRRVRVTRLSGKLNAGHQIIILGAVSHEMGKYIQNWHVVSVSARLNISFLKLMREFHVHLVLLF
jgi:hypothetical protein